MPSKTNSNSKTADLTNKDASHAWPKLYHNPRCSKSRQSLALLQEHNIEPHIILYLENTPSQSQLKILLDKLNINARELLRKGENIYKTLNLKDDTLSESFLIKTMVEHPILIERPIFETDAKACIGRPPENILSLIK